MMLLASVLAAILIFLMIDKSICECFQGYESFHNEKLLIQFRTEKSSMHNLLQLSTWPYQYDISLAS